MSDGRQTVFIVEDDSAVGEALCALFDSAGVRARHFLSAEAFLDAWYPAMAGCLVLDVRLPGMNGLELQTKLHADGIGLPVILMTAHGDIPMVRKALKGGAVEFLTKPIQDEELLQAVELAFKVEHSGREEAQILSSIRARMESLTPRERLVMNRITAGFLNKEIAADLNVSEITIKVHRRQVMEKMQAASFAELVQMCERINAAERRLSTG